METSTLRGKDLAARPGMESGAAFIDGEVVPIGEAKISILDTGFSRSDVTYDVIGLWEGAFFLLDYHLDRFERSCRELRMELPYSRQEIVDILTELVVAADLRDSYVEVICTRGITNPSRDPRTFENRFYAYAVPFVWILPEEEGEKGMEAIIARTVERISPRAIDPTVKNFHWGDLTKALFEAYDRGARYPILLNAEGNVTEGAGYNVFALVDGRLLTPVSGTLRGGTQKAVIELAEGEGIPTEVRDVPEAEFRRGEELFSTTTAGGVMPITSLDGEPVGDGKVGPVTRKLRDLYWAAHRDPRYITPVHYPDTQR
jgi:branched-chain amino acid aminotransferase